jgi:hypothetical protein
LILLAFKEPENTRRKHSFLEQSYFSLKVIFTIILIEIYDKPPAIRQVSIKKFEIQPEYA